MNATFAFGPGFVDVGNRSNLTESVQELRSESGRILGALCLTVVMILALLGNALVIAAVLYSSKLQEHAPNYFIVNLSITDFLTAAAVMPFAILSMISDDWYFGSTWCQLHCAVNYCCIIVSMLTLCIIAVDRYLAAVNPATYTKVMTKSAVYTYIVCVWFQAVVFAIVPVISSWVIYDYWELVCAIDWNYRHSKGPLVYVAVAFVLCFLIPCVAMILANVKVYRLISKHKTAAGQGSLMSSQDRKIFTSIAVVIAIFVVCMAPFCITKLVKIVTSKYSFPGPVNTFASFMQFLASATNPFVYGIYRRDLRHVFRRMLCFRRFVKVEPHTNGSSNNMFSLSRCETSAKSMGTVVFNVEVEESLQLEDVQDDDDIIFNTTAAHHID